MKILFIARHLGRAGAERQLVALANAMAKHGHDVVVATLRPGALDGDLRTERVRLESLAAPTRWSVPAGVVRAVRLTRSFRPDVVHGYLDAPNLISLIAARLAWPAVAVWSVRSSAMEPSDMPRLSRALYWLEPRVARYAALVISNSRSGMRDAVARRYPESRLIVVPNGIDSDHFQADAEEGARFRAELGISPSATVIGRVGRLHPMKDYESFVDAFARVHADRPNTVAVCVGSGTTEYSKSLYQRSARLGLADAMHWLPARADIRAVFSAADIFVSSSSYGEGFPNVVGEAMACELPAVATDVGDSAWIVGDCGAVASPGDPGKLATAIRSILDLPDSERRDMGKRARDRIRVNFSVSRLVANTTAALETVISQSAVN